MLEAEVEVVEVETREAVVLGGRGTAAFSEFVGVDSRKVVATATASVELLAALLPCSTHELLALVELEPEAEASGPSRSSSTALSDMSVSGRQQQDVSGQRVAGRCRRVAVDSACGLTILSVVANNIALDAARPLV